MRNLFSILVVLFSLMFTTTAVADNTIDLNPEDHSFVIDTVYDYTTSKVVVLSIYKNGVKQPRKIEVHIDYKSRDLKNVMQAAYDRSKYLTPKHFVSVSIFLTSKAKPIELSSPFYLFIDKALLEANIKP